MKLDPHIQWCVWCVHGIADGTQSIHHSLFVSAGRKRAIFVEYVFLIFTGVRIFCFIIAGWGKKGLITTVFEK